MTGVEIFISLVQFQSTGLSLKIKAPAWMISMYTPKHFEQPNIKAIYALIDKNPLATLITSGADGLCANHIPMLLSESVQPYGVLSGHIPRANPLSHETAEPDGLVIFHGVNSYISPSWYASKAESGKVVPTWNYTVVHARGRIRLIDDAEWVLAHLKHLTDKFEATLPEPWAVTDAPIDFIANLLPHLIGIEIVIDKLEGKWKVSQNRSAADRVGVANGLQNLGDANALQMAELLTRRPLLPG